jgi:AcrR family transcriptional regulator
MPGSEKKPKTRTKSQATKNHILQQAEELFIKHGVSKVTVDEVARELGMSKKTIYLYFPDKKTLIKNIIHKNQQELMNRVDENLDNKELNFIQKLQSMMSVLMNFLTKISPIFIRDLKRQYPDLWLQINEFKEKQGFKRIQLIAEEGVKDGMIRNDIPLPLIITLYFLVVENIIISERVIHLPYSTQELFTSVIKFIYGGILTDSARQLFFKGEKHD